MNDDESMTKGRLFVEEREKKAKKKFQSAIECTGELFYFDVACIKQERRSI